MRVRTLSLMSVAVLVVGMVPTLAASTPKRGSDFSLPDSAVRVADGVYALGQAVDPGTGKKVEGYAILHPRNNGAKPPNTPGGGGATNSCYAYLAKGAAWKSVEDWVMNPSNASGMQGSTLFGLEGAALAKWEDATDGTVNGAAAVQIFGNGSSTNNALVADEVQPDDQNEIYFADVSGQGTIAVTIVWGIFGGPPSGRELVEWDQVYDDADFGWSTSGQAGLMDFDNIATHEVGHAAGMGHPSSGCTEETMYAYADYGETKKQTLNTGDINGINGLY